MRIFTSVDQSNLQKVPALTKQLEAKGFTGVTTFENRHDPFLPLAIAATHSTSIELTTGVAIAFLRSPMSTAQIAWDINNVSTGRLTLGLGPQIKAHNEKRFSVPWSAPAPRLREYVNALRAIWKTWKTGEALDFAGEHYRFSLMPPNFVPENTAIEPPAVTLAAVGPSMISLASEVADGIQLHPFCTKEYIEKMVIPKLRNGFCKSNINRKSFEISGGGFLATGPTEEAVIKISEWVRYRIGFYASTPAYWPVLECSGFEDIGPKLNLLTKQGKWDQLAKEVPEELLHACAAVGTHAQIVEKIRNRFGGLVDTLQASQSYEIPSDLPLEVIQDIKNIPTEFKAFDRTRYLKN
jgi:probable F420-dependent oxidoreductase